MLLYSDWFFIISAVHIDVSLFRSKFRVLFLFLSCDRQRRNLADGVLSAANCEVIVKIYGEIGAEVLEQVSRWETECKNIVDLLCHLSPRIRSLALIPEESLTFSRWGNCLHWCYFATFAWHRQVKHAPAVAIPIVLNRLREKEELWQKAKAELLPGWQTEIGKIYDGFLDHRGSSFQEKERERLSTKELLGEVKRKYFVAMKFPDRDLTRTEMKRLTKIGLQWECDEAKQELIFARYERFVSSFLNWDPQERETTMTISAFGEERHMVDTERCFYATEEIYMLLRFEHALREKIDFIWQLSVEKIRKERRNNE